MEECAHGVTITRVDKSSGFCPTYCIFTATAVPFIYSFSGNSAASAPIPTFMCLWAIYTYIPRIGPHISSSRKGRPIVGIYNSLIDTWMWKLGLRLQYSFSGNICFKFSAFCLCSAPVFTLVSEPYLREPYNKGRCFASPYVQQLSEYFTLVRISTHK